MSSPPRHLTAAHRSTNTKYLHIYFVSRTSSTSFENMTAFNYYPTTARFNSTVSFAEHIFFSVSSSFHLYKYKYILLLLLLADWLSAFVSPIVVQHSHGYCLLSQQLGKSMPLRFMCKCRKYWTKITVFFCIFSCVHTTILQLNIMHIWLEIFVGRLAIDSWFLVAIQQITGEWGTIYTYAVQCAHTKWSLEAGGSWNWNRMQEMDIFGQRIKFRGVLLLFALQSTAMRPWGFAVCDQCCCCWTQWRNKFNNKTRKSSGIIFTKIPFGLSKVHRNVTIRKQQTNEQKIATKN